MVGVPSREGERRPAVYYFQYIYRNYQPSISSLELICRAFGITLAQFFADGNFVELTDEQYGFFNRWAALRPEQKRLVDELIGQFK